MSWQISSPMEVVAHNKSQGLRLNFLGRRKYLRHPGQNAYDKPVELGTLDFNRV